MERIPAELRALPQWVVARENRIPLDPKTGREASPTDPSTWSTYQQARACGLPHVGFVLSPNDPYVIIDLDDKEHKPITSDEKAKHFKADT
jgi:primase-polymerase (primpol)-like protein